MFIAQPADSAETTSVYKGSVDAQGYVTNLVRAWAWRPEVFEGFAALRNQLMSQSRLSKRDYAVMVCATASELGDAYCSLAWGKILSQEAGAGIAAAVISDSGAGDSSLRDRTLAGWARKVVANPNATRSSDVDALREVGLSDREIFEATAFIAFRLAFATVNDALGIPPDGRLFETTPPEVRAAVTFGRSAAAS
jgi:uncharacterized peroxidase-related enzyme